MPAAAAWHVSITGARPHFRAIDFAQALAIDVLIAPFSVPVGIVIGAPIGLLCGLAIATYLRVARRRGWGHPVGVAFRIIVAAVVAAAVLFACAIALSIKSASIQNAAAACVAVGVIPAIVAVPIAMWGTRRLVRAVERSTTIRRLPDRAGFSA